MRMLVSGEDMEDKLEARLTHEREEIKPGDGAIVAIVYDNNLYDRRLIPAWGFSSVVTVPEKNILFDTGGDGGILLDNMKKLGIRPSEIDVVVLSHIHGDHTGGLKEFLRYNSQVTVYLPGSFPTQIKQNIGSLGAEVKSVREPEELFEGVFTTGELDGGIEEQSLLVKASEVFCIITGCAHPGIINVTKRAKEITGKEVYLAMGGFHLSGAFRSQISYVAESLLRLGVQKVASCHCSGDEARKLFKDYFGENYIDSGVGKEIIVE
jgi:7,8-dihydropterin-6-yl-methyl-4-(beta-D-ribofuranosyl)aminobenzene 5'-phosphate synthase